LCPPESGFLLTNLIIKKTTQGFKLGICAKPPVGVPNSLLCLANNCAIAGTFTTMRERFNKLYKRRVYTHHYEQYMELSAFDRAAETVTGIIDAYNAVDTVQPPPVTRLRPRGLGFL
jgi:tubulin epsilon